MSSPHTCDPHTMSSSPPGSNGRLPACVDRISTSAPSELLEAPPLFAIPSRRERFVASFLPSFGATASGSGLTNSFRLIKLSSKRFACAGSFFINVVILVPHSSVCGCPITKQPLQPNVAPNSDTIFFVMKMRLTFFSSRVCVTDGPASFSGFTIGMYLAGAVGLESTSTRPSCKPHKFLSIHHSISRFQRFLRMLRHDTTAALLLTMCSSVLVLKPSQQPSFQFT